MTQWAWFGNTGDIEIDSSLNWKNRWAWNIWETCEIILILFEKYLKDICLNLKSRWGAIKSGRPTTWLADSNRAVNRVKHSMVSFRRRGSFQEIICQACAIPFHYQHCGLIVQFNVQLNVLSTHKFFSNIFWIYSFKIYLFFPWIYSSENVFP